MIPAFGDSESVMKSAGTRLAAILRPKMCWKVQFEKLQITMSVKHRTRRGERNGAKFGPLE